MGIEGFSCGWTRVYMVQLTATHKEVNIFHGGHCYIQIHVARKPSILL